MTVAELRKALEELPGNMQVHLLADLRSNRLKKIWVSRNWDDGKKKIKEHLVLDAEPAKTVEEYYR